MKFEKPNQNVTDLDVTFGPKNMTDFLPAAKDIPEQFWKTSDKWSAYISSWFFNGLSEWPIAKPGINFKIATAHIRTIITSYEPKHEHKIAGCAYLASLWFDEKTLDGGKSK